MSNSLTNKAQCIGTSDITFATNDSKDKMYEPKHKKKLVRVLTVVAYVFSVSLAAIMLSLFYIFIYNPQRHAEKNTTTADARNVAAATGLSIKEIVDQLCAAAKKLENYPYDETKQLEEPRVLPNKNENSSTVDERDRKPRQRRFTPTTADSQDTQRFINLLKILTNT